jgi:hypothetical protein
VALKKKKKKGSYNMQSIGLCAKDDNAKGELIDGGGGTLYEQDVTDDEQDKAAEAEDKAVKEDKALFATPPRTTTTTAASTSTLVTHRGVSLLSVDSSPRIPLLRPFSLRPATKIVFFYSSIEN